MTSENGRHDQGEYAQRPKSSLRIVYSVAGGETWHALWDWLLAPEPSKEQETKESEVTDDDSEG